MTTRYVDGTGVGSDAYDGLAAVWNGVHGPKATLNGAEDTPVVAGDLVHVRPGTYRELLTVDVNGGVGSVIEYRGDYGGLIWTSTAGQPVRITGSDNDQTATRANCITATTKIYRTFTNFVLDLATGDVVSLLTSCTNITLNKCHISYRSKYGVEVTGASQAAITISNCFFTGGDGGGTAIAILFSHSSTVSNAGHLVSNCIIRGAYTSNGVYSSRVGGITVQNSLVLCQCMGVYIGTALAVGQTVTVNNCIFEHCNTALLATALGEITEDCNNITNCCTARMNVGVGASSLAYAPSWDTRWFMQLVNAGAGPNSVTQIVSPYDLASYSQLLNVAGTSPSATDMRGTAIQGAAREWGALEYDGTLKVQGGGGPVGISPIRGSLM